MPGTLKPSSRKELVSSIDILPTILNAADMEIPQNLPGLNLWDALKNEKIIDRNITFGEAYSHVFIDKENPEASLGYPWCIEDDWKLILSYDGVLEGGNGGYDFTHNEVRSGPIHLYKIVDDPFEKKNLASEYPDKVGQLKEKIEAWYPLKESASVKSNVK